MVAPQYIYTIPIILGFETWVKSRNNFWFTNTNFISMFEAICWWCWCLMLRKIVCVCANNNHILYSSGIWNFLALGIYILHRNFHLLSDGWIFKTFEQRFENPKIHKMAKQNEADIIHIYLHLLHIHRIWNICINHIKNEYSQPIYNIKYIVSRVAWVAW